MREPNFNAPMKINGGEWRLFNLAAKPQREAFELIYRTDLEIVEKATSNHFEVTVYIFWETYYDPDFEPGPEILFGITRTSIREYFTANRFPPRESGAGRRSIELRWPLLDEYKGTV